MTNSKQEPCPECSSDDYVSFDPFGIADLIDEHLDAVVSEEEMAKRVSKAMEMANKLGGLNKGGMEDELAELSKPKLHYTDFIRSLTHKKKHETAKNNWNEPKRRALFAGLYLPKKQTRSVKFLLAYDCSASMRPEQIAYGISQIAALADNGFGDCVPWDAGPFWDQMTSIHTASTQNLQALKYKGGGGTVLMPLLKEYEQKVGKVDILVIVSDFELFDLSQVEKYIPSPGTHIVWLNVRGNKKFKPISGRVFELDGINAPR